MRFWDDFVPAVVLTGVLTAGFFVSDLSIPGLGLRPFCLVHSVTGLDCPGCGLSRAFLLIPKGGIIEAVKLNAAAPLLYGLFLVGWFKKIFQIMKWKFPGKDQRWKNIQAALGVAVVVLMLTHWSFKTSSYFSKHSLVDVVVKTRDFKVTNLFGVSE